MVHGWLNLQTRRRRRDERSDNELGLRSFLEQLESFLENISTSILAKKFSAISCS